MSEMKIHMPSRPKGSSAVKPQFDPKIVDALNSPILYIDWIINAGLGPSSGAISLDLGAIVPAISSEDRPHVLLQCKLRLTPATANNIVRSLNVALTLAQAPVKDEVVN